MRNRSHAFINTIIEIIKCIYVGLFDNVFCRRTAKSFFVQKINKLLNKNIILKENMACLGLEALIRASKNSKSLFLVL